jgi:enoyl-CoA hydratase
MVSWPVPLPPLSRAGQAGKFTAMSDYEFVDYSQDGPVVTITFDRPDRLNAVGPVMSRELVDAWSRFRDDDGALVGVLTGRGGEAFCSGGDLKGAFEDESVLADTLQERAAHALGERPGILGPTRWNDLYKPTIAAVNGVAYAGGLEWVCWTDMAIAEEHATFGVTCRRWNIGLADGGTQRLPRIVGFRRAMELIITGRVIDAGEALDIGLVNEVVQSGESLSRAHELAHFIATLPQEAIRTDKEAALRGWGLPAKEGLRIEAECFNRLIDGEAMAEGLRRFNERDHPDRRDDSEALTPGISRPRTGK